MAIERGRVELTPGAITPVSRGLWHAAGEKFAEAKKGVEQMRQAKDRIEYEAGWTRFVDSLEEFWARFFDEGKATFSSFQPWAGAIDAERKKDPLLSYIYQARHQSQHGRIILAWEEGSIQVGGGEYFGTVKDLKISGDGTFVADVKSTSGSKGKFNVSHEPGNPRLPAVLNKKYGQEFQPPSSHLGQSLRDTSPMHAANLALEFYEKKFRQAFEKFTLAP
jgi:hypothetical protein